MSLKKTLRQSTVETSLLHLKRVEKVLVVVEEVVEEGLGKAAKAGTPVPVRRTVVTV